MPIYINQKDNKITSNLAPVIDNLMEENSIAVNEESVDLEGSEARSRSRQNQFKLALDCKSYRYDEDE